MNKKAKNIKVQNIYIGCGNDFKPDFFHVDTKAQPHINMVCKPWELSLYKNELNLIYSKHILESLTNYEADRTLRDWFKALKTNGTIETIVYDMDFYAQQWLNATWDQNTIRQDFSQAKKSFKSFWGSQLHCDPWSKDYTTDYENVHKSGYNTQRMELLLERIGYTNILIKTDSEGLLFVQASKPKYSGERQVGTTLESIRKDHLNRYSFAAKYIAIPNSIVIDAACGVGYGSFVLAQNENIAKIYSLDISKEALNHAKEYFNHLKIKHSLVNLETEFLQIPLADYFISFETIEHLNNVNQLFAKIASQLKPGGVFIGSTPNEDIMPFNKQNFMYHTRHFTEKDLKFLLQEHGFINIDFYQQKRAEPSLIEKNSKGQYIVFIAQKN